MVGDKGLAGILAAAVCTPQNDSASLLCRPGNASAAGSQRVTGWHVYTRGSRDSGDEWGSHQDRLDRGRGAGSSFLRLTLALIHGSQRRLDFRAPECQYHGRVCTGQTYTLGDCPVWKSERICYEGQRRRFVPTCFALPFFFFFAFFFLLVFR